MKAARRAGMLAFFSRSEPNKLMIDKVWLPKPKQKEFLKSLEYRTLESGENEVENRRWNEEGMEMDQREDSQVNFGENPAAWPPLISGSETLVNRGAMIVWAVRRENLREIWAILQGQRNNLESFQCGAKEKKRKSLLISLLYQHSLTT